MTDVVSVPSMRFDILIAGDIEDAKRICREWCMEVGACVTVEAASFIYTGGQEEGVRVGFINYPRFPSEHDALLEKAQSLADRLMHKLCQLSYTIEGPRDTVWHSRRPKT
jgi:hypothetical protein